MLSPESTATWNLTVNLTWKRLLTGIAVAALLGATVVAADPQKGPPPGKGPGGKGGGAMAHDRDVFHFLLEHHKDIKRTVKKLDNGVETLTESDRPEVAAKIQEHVPAMEKQMKEGHAVRHWDPLFVEIARHARKITMKIEKTKKGVKVNSTSDDPRAVKLIQAHAEVVSKFVEKGFAEAHKEHRVPTESGK